MIDDRSKYIEVILLIDDLKFFLSISKSELSTSYFRSLKHNIQNLYILTEVLDKNSRYLRNNNEFNCLKKSIRKELEFINHIRNKISGHTDKSVMKKAAQWRPEIFYCNNLEKSVFYSYMAIFESSINSYIDMKDGKHKLFNEEIDLFLVDSRCIFMNMIEKLNKAGLELLGIIKSEFEQKQIFIKTNKQIIKESLIAGLTDFNLNTDFDNDVNTEINSILAQIENLDIDKFDIDELALLVARVMAKL